MRFQSEESRYSRYARASRAQSKRLVVYAVLLVVVIGAMFALRRKPSIEWLLSFEEAAARAKATGKPMMVYFFAKGEEGCARMENVTFAHQAVRAEADKFVCVRLESKAEPELAERYYIVGCPAVAFVAPDGQLLYTVLNARDPDEFVHEMRQAFERPKRVPDREATLSDEQQLTESPGLPPKNAEPSRGEAD